MRYFGFAGLLRENPASKQQSQSYLQLTKQSQSTTLLKQFTKDTQNKFYTRRKATQKSRLAPKLLKNHFDIRIKAYMETNDYLE